VAREEVEEEEEEEVVVVVVVVVVEEEVAMEVDLRKFLRLLHDVAFLQRKREEALLCLEAF